MIIGLDTKKLFDSRNDDLILNFKNSIENTHKDNGRLIFIGNGASASLSSHAATDFTKQAKIQSIAFNDHNLITAFSNDYGYEFWISKALEYYSKQMIWLYLSVLVANLRI